MSRPRIRQPRVAEIVAARLREDILSGRLREGDILPTQESLFVEFGVSPPAVREAVHLLETDGLVSVRRGNMGGAVVRQPSAERTAQMISMVLQSLIWRLLSRSRSTTTTTPRSTCRTHGGFTKSWSPGAEMSR